MLRLSLPLVPPHAAWLLAAVIAAAVPPRSPSDRARRPNRLIHEKSPYLLQHASNPVDWYPWGEEAFEKARREGKPIFLSIGYSTCHWCHVMEHESFENDTVAEALNRDYVAIKVDREERPDVDRIYMTGMQALGMGGGWPLNVFLTPDLQPFYGGTYFPPHGMGGRPGLVEVLEHIHRLWVADRGNLEHAGDRVLKALAEMDHAEPRGLARRALLEQAWRDLSRSADRERGGFGGSPKFPTTVNLDFLWAWWDRDHGAHGEARELIRRQLDAMRRGGIHDHLGGGFHRYATDAGWQVPHFEKMLYDQALIARAFLDGARNLGDPAYAETARGVFAYVARDLTSPAGGFYSAEDADSEGEEGRFYVWTPAQVEAVLGAADARAFCHHYGVTAGGNFEHATSILHVVPPEDEARRAPHDGAGEVPFAAMRAKLLEARSLRPRPHRDDKVLTAWNGLMISAYARGARVLDDPSLAAPAERAAEFVWDHLRDPATGALRRRWREGEAAGAGQLDDYAYYAMGLLDLYQATFDPRWLERAVAVTEAQVERFWDEKGGGFFESPAGDPSIKLRMKDGFDGAEMAGNSIAALNLQTLAALLDRADWRAKAGRTFDYYARRLAESPAAMPEMLVAMDLADASPRHVVIVGRPGAADTRGLIAEYQRRFLPHDLLLVLDPGPRQAALARLAPFVGSLTAKDGKATAYVCVDYACRLPTTDPQAFAAQLDEAPAARSTR